MASFQLESALERASREPGSRRAVILREATRLFAERGYDAVTVRDIASAAGTNVATVPFHWQNKATLYAAALRASARMLAGFLIRIAESASEQGLTLEEQTDRWVDWLGEIAANQPSLARFHLRHLIDGHRHAPGELDLHVETARAIARYMVEEPDASAALQDDALVLILATFYQVLLFGSDPPLQQALLGASVLESERLRERLGEYTRSFIRLMWRPQ